MRVEIGIVGRSICVSHVDDGAVRYWRWRMVCGGVDVAGAGGGLFLRGGVGVVHWVGVACL